MAKIKRHKIVYRKKCHELAPHIATARSEASKYAYKEGSSRYRENEVEVSTKGVEAELICRDWIRSQTMIGKFEEVELGQLVDLDPDIAPDGSIDGKPFDTKWKSSNGNRVFINYNSHNNPDKKADNYFLVQGDEGTCHAEMCDGVIYEIPHDEVSNWDYTDRWVDKCYFHDIQEADCEDV